MPLDTFLSVTYDAPGRPGGSDRALLHSGVPVSFFGHLRERALRLSEPGAELAGSEWRDVEVRIVWGDASIWEVPYLVMCMKEELQAERGQGSPMRNVDFARVRGANHFVSKIVLLVLTLYSLPSFHRHIGIIQRRCCAHS